MDGIARSATSIRWLDVAERCRGFWFIHGEMPPLLGNRPFEGVVFA